MNVNEIVTKTIIERLQEAEKSGETFYWAKPFGQGAATVPLSYENSRAYTGVNRCLLEPNEFITARKGAEYGYHIRKGARANIVIFFSRIPKTDENGEPIIDKDTGEVITRGFLRYYHVFSREDMIDRDGNSLPSKLDFKRYNHEEQLERMKQVIEMFNRMVEQYCHDNNIKIEVVKDGTQAYYSPSQDVIRIPDISSFDSVFEYISTLSHELGHSTAKKMNRELGHTQEKYGYEELVAELTSAYIIQNLGAYGLIDDRKHKENTLAYLQGWSSFLKDKSSAVVSAAAKAQEASDYILSYLPERERNKDISKNRDEEER